ncbi:RluA family pseudouridine synthase [Dysgonomonas sp. 216]|uniref:RluA family pseudouridine synthase n=1 Tax=Dysgonomonas sp. 216 TaxID=2302934 RepID=UPI0013D1F370|nr:RluA family pseudouridine synthase [Dysgonomonas sp. 216]NDW18610.1 RluA family pseudouridine synthase [Dysgonomonas sp. 216]
MSDKEKSTILQTLTAGKSGEELLSFLIEKKVRKSRSAVKSLLVHKQIKVNGRVISQHNYELNVGDVVTIHKADQKHTLKQLKGITIIYEDDYFIVVEKEPGLLSVATERGRDETAYGIVNSYLKNQNKGERAYVIHRLDREISGLMMYVKSPEVQETMQINGDKLILLRSYVVVVEGKVAQPEGTIVSWLTEDKNYIMHSSEKDNGGQKSVTHYKLMKGVRRFTQLYITLDTARKNQIRVHMKHIGHPVVGDKKYGASINPIKRVALHAYELSFRHPVTGEIIDLKSPVPKRMQMLVEPEENKI